MHEPRGTSRYLLTVFFVSTWLICTGCNGSAGDRRRLQSLSPIERARATIAVAEARDARAIHKLVDLLEDADPAVRMFAIQALVRLSGKDYGYRYYRPELQRGAAVKRWRAALRDNEVVLRSSGRAAGKSPTGGGALEIGASEPGASEPGAGNAGAHNAGARNAGASQLDNGDKREMLAGSASPPTRQPSESDAP